jgi:hypothetical protein
MEIEPNFYRTVALQLLLQMLDTVQNCNGFSVHTVGSLLSAK